MIHSISRNIAIVSAIFIATFSIMLITNYFQVSNANTLQWDVIEKLKQANEERGDDTQLQEQIRELDLLARKAYFISHSRLKSGIAILLVMTVVFVVSLRVYFVHCRNIPNKEIDPVDDWIIKSKTRRYLIWGTGTLALGGTLFALLTSPYMKERLSDSQDVNNTSVAKSALSAEGFDSSQGGSALLQENPALSQEGPALSQESSALLQEGSTLSQEGPTLSQEGSALSQEDPTLSQESSAPVSQATTPSEDARKEVVLDAITASNVTHNGFRGDYSLGISNAKNVPTSWDLSSGKNILWKIKTPRKGHNSPIINGNKVFFSGADLNARELFCYDLHSGKEVWRLTVQNVSGSPTKMPEISDETGFAASGVATNGKQVCAIFPNGDVVCTDTNGKQLWTKNLGVPDNVYGYASSLLIYENVLIIQYDNHDSKKVIALDITTGNQRWSQARAERNPSWSTPIIAMVNNQPQLILIGNPGVTSYNPNSGVQNWRVECMSGEPAASAAYANGIVFAATEYATLIAINATDGSTLWKENEFLPDVASPVATKDFVFIATGYGVVATHNAQTGALIKYMELSTMFYSSPIVVEDKIYLISNDGEVYIFSAEGDFRLITSFETGEHTYTTPAFTNNKIVIRTEENIYCVGY